MRSSCLFFLIFLPLFLSPAQTKSKTSHTAIVGEVIDSKCYLSKGEEGRGEKHKGCAIDCAKGGIPLALLEEETNLVYFLVKARGMSDANEMLMPFVAEKVSVTGKLTERGGVRMIVVDSIEKTR